MRNTLKGRLKVWDRAQDSFNGDDLVYNFDTIDSIIGGPNGYPGISGTAYAGVASTWLGNNDVIPVAPTEIKYPGISNGSQFQTGKRTLYSIVSGLNYNDVPLGTIIQWWRPTTDFTFPDGKQFPDGWVVCDGRTVLQEDHSYPLPGPIRVPDLRNKMVVGADPTIPGINAFNGYQHASGATAAQDADNLYTSPGASPKLAGQTGAPGVGYDSGLEAPASFTGSNAKRTMLHSHNPGTLAIRDHYHGFDHTHAIPKHRHPIEKHNHRFSHIHLTPNHVHNFNGSVDFMSKENLPGDASAVSVMPVANGTPGSRSVAPDDHRHKIDLNLAGNTGDRDAMKSNKVADSPHGLYPDGGDSSPWPYWRLGFKPENMTFSGANGYTMANPTSLPTKYSVSGQKTFIGHHLNEYTEKGTLSSDADTTLESTELSSSLTTGITTDGFGRKVDQLTSGIMLDYDDTTPLATRSGKTVAYQKGLDGFTANSQQPEMNIRPQYVGLLYLIKVKVSTNVI